MIGTNTVGHRIRLKRKALKLTQSNLSSAIGVTKASVSQWEKGITRNLKAAHLIRLCDVLDVDPKWILYGEKNDTPSPKSNNGDLTERDFDFALTATWPEATKRDGSIEGLLTLRTIARFAFGNTSERFIDMDFLLDLVIEQRFKIYWVTA